MFNTANSSKVKSPRRYSFTYDTHPLYGYILKCDALGCEMIAESKMKCVQRFREWLLEYFSGSDCSVHITSGNNGGHVDVEAEDNYTYDPGVDWPKSSKLEVAADSASTVDLAAEETVGDAAWWNISDAAFFCSVHSLVVYSWKCPKCV